jgi:hypothetical protein
MTEPTMGVLPIHRPTLNRNPTLEELDEASDPCENCGRPVITLTHTLSGCGPDRVMTDVYQFGPNDDPVYPIKVEVHKPWVCRRERREHDD